MLESSQHDHDHQLLEYLSPPRHHIAVHRLAHAVIKIINCSKLRMASGVSIVLADDALDESVNPKYHVRQERNASE